MKNGIVYSENGIYAGWPANHGAWQWGDEFLVGFLRGKFKSKSMHNIAEPFEKMLARTIDGGMTWTTETPNLDFDALSVTDEAPEFSLSDSIIRVCGVYDHGGDYSDARGAFYLSRDRGKEWSGPYLFNGIDMGERMLNTSRTRVVGNLVFLSICQENSWGTDATLCVSHDGMRFNRIGTVADDDARAVMPAVAKVGDRLIALLRRRQSGRRDGWIDAFVSDDGGVTWRFQSFVGPTGWHNGNPPALVVMDDGRLLAAFGNRDQGSILGAWSTDRGHTWSSFTIRASESERVDIGYPQLFKRDDGSAVCVYYWTSDDRPHQHIASTLIDA